MPFFLLDDTVKWFNGSLGAVKHPSVLGIKGTRFSVSPITMWAFSVLLCQAQRGASGTQGW